MGYGGQVDKNSEFVRIKRDCFACFRQTQKWDRFCEAGSGPEFSSLLDSYARGCEPACRKPRSVKPDSLDVDCVGCPILKPGARPFLNDEDMHDYFIGNSCGDRLSVIDQRLIIVVYQMTDNIRYIRGTGGVMPPYLDYADNRSMVVDPATGFSPSTVFPRKYTDSDFLRIQEECETHIFYSMFGCSSEDYRQ